MKTPNQPKHYTGIFLVTFFLFFSQFTSATTWYVSTGGTDAAPPTWGLTIAKPFKTIGHALTYVGTGDILLIDAGTYAETGALAVGAVNNVVIEAYNSSTPPCIQYNLGTNSSHLLEIDNGAYDITLRNLILDGNFPPGSSNSGNCSMSGLKITGGAHDVLVEDCEVRYSGGNGISVGYLVTNIPYNLTFRRVDVHHNGFNTGPGTANSVREHGMYLSGTYMTIENCTVHSNKHHGIRSGTDHTPYSQPYNNNIIRNNLVYLNGTLEGHAAIVVERCTTGVEIYNNICYSNGLGIYLLNGADNVNVLNNTVYNTWYRCGILINNDGGYACTGLVVTNNLLYKNSNACNTVGIDIHSSCSMTDVDNITEYNNVDPLFVDGGAGDLNLRSGSPALGGGSTNPIATDYYGNSRSTPCTVGAIEGSATSSYGPVRTTFYVDDISGNDENAGSSAFPYKTFNRGLVELRPGCTLEVDDGTYTQPSWSRIPTGTSTGRITIRAKFGAQPILKPATIFNSAAPWNVLWLGQCAYNTCFDGYVTIDGFTIDASDLVATNGGASCVQIADNAQQVIIQNCELVGATTGVLVAAQGLGVPPVWIEPEDNQLINCTITACPTCTSDVGVNVFSQNNEITNCTITGFDDKGVVLNNSHNTIERCTINGGGKGILLNNSDNSTYVADYSIVKNNLVVNNTGEGIYLGRGPSYGGVDHCKIYNNTITGNGKGIFFYNDYSDYAEIVNNISFSNGSSTADNLIANPTYVTNLTDEHNLVSVDPLFVDAGSDDYHLQECSPAVNNGTNASSVLTNDKDDNSRIITNAMGGAYDIGAYEYQSDFFWTGYGMSDYNAECLSGLKTKVTEGFYIMAGETHYGSSSTSRAYMIKTDVHGVTTTGWQKIFNLAGVSSAKLLSVIELSDGSGYAAVGSVEFTVANKDVLFMVVDQYGDITVVKHIDLNSGLDEGTALVESTSDNGTLYVTGNSWHSGVSTPFLVKIDQDGTIDWAYSYPNCSTCDDLSNTAAAILDDYGTGRSGNIVIAGSSYDNNATNTDGLILSVDRSSGSLSSNTTYDWDEQEYFTSIVNDNNNDWVIAGSKANHTGTPSASSMLICKTNNLAAPQWSYESGGYSTYLHFGKGVLAKTNFAGDEEYYVAGYLREPTYNYHQAVVLGLNENGTHKSTIAYHHNDYDVANAIGHNCNESFTFFGRTKINTSNNTGFLLNKISFSAFDCEDNALSPTHSTITASTSSITLDDDDTYSAGSLTSATPNSGSRYAFSCTVGKRNLLSVEPFSKKPADAKAEATNNEDNGGSLIHIYPNPGTAIFNIESKGTDATDLTISALDGKVVYDGPMTNGKSTCDLGSASPGVYTVRIASANGTQFSKLVIVR